MEYINDIYGNIFEMINYRGGEAKSARLTTNQLIQNLASVGFVSVRAFVPQSYWGAYNLEIFLFAVDSKYVGETSSLRKLLGTIDKYTGAWDILFVSAAPVATQLVKMFAEYTGQIRISRFTYDIFSENIPLCSEVDKHTIMSASEAEFMTTRMYAPFSSLCQISYTDPPVAWLGGRPGCIIQIETTSLNVGEAPEYRACI